MANHQKVGDKGTGWNSGLVLALVGTFLFSSKGIFIKLAYRYGIDTITLLSLRMIFSLPFYGVLLFWSFARMERGQAQQALEPAGLLKISVLGVLGYYLASFLDLEALHFISVQLERLVLLTYPIFVAVISWIIFGNRITGNVFLSLLVSYCGIALLFGHDLQHQTNLLWGIVLVIMAALSFAVYFALSKTHIKRTGSVFFTCVAMISAAIVVLLHFFVSHDLRDLFVQREILVLAAVLAVFCTVLPSFLMTEAISRIGPVSTSMIGSAGPFFTAILAIVILGEGFTVFHVIGMTLAITGVYILGRGTGHDR